MDDDDAFFFQEDVLEEEDIEIDLYSNIVGHPQWLLKQPAAVQTVPQAGLPVLNDNESEEDLGFDLFN